jgi:uncharacterized protein YukE
MVSPSGGSGSDILSQYTSVVSDIKADAKGEGPGVVGTVVDGISDAANIAGAVADPLGAVISAGVGWLVNHISFIKEPIDKLLGDPQAIAQNTQALDQLAQQIDQLAQDHNDKTNQLQSSFSGQAADAMNATMDQMGGQLGALAQTVDGTSAVVAISGGLVSALHDIVVQTICDLISELIEGALIAAATAVISCGASEVIFAGVAAGRAAAEVAKITTKITKLTSALARMGERLSKLQGMMGDLAKSLDRFGQGGAAIQTAQGFAQGLGSGSSGSSGSDGSGSSGSDSGSSDPSGSDGSSSSDSDSGSGGSDSGSYGTDPADYSDGSDSGSYGADSGSYDTGGYEITSGQLTPESEGPLAPVNTTYEPPMTSRIEAQPEQPMTSPISVTEQQPAQPLLDTHIGVTETPYAGTSGVVNKTPVEE